MKPALMMDCEKPSVISLPVSSAVTHEITDKREWSATKKVAVGVIVGLVALVVVATVVIVSVHYGMKLSHETFKTAQTFVTDTGRVTQEETQVTNNDVDIKVPNGVEVVYDYKYGLVVERFINQETKKRSACYARYMNVSQAPSRDAADYAGNGEVTLDASEGEYKEEWISTDRKVPRYMVSEAVERLCHDTEIYWMEQTQTSEVAKRLVKYLYSKFHSCYKTTLACQYRCYATEVWYDTDNSLYYYITRWNNYCLDTCASLYSYC